jgi:hypothetical protein
MSSLRGCETGGGKAEAAAQQAGRRFGGELLQPIMLYFHAA